MKNEFTSKRISRLVIFLSFLIAAVCGIESYDNYDGWKTYKERYHVSAVKYDTAIRQCSNINDSISRDFCINQVAILSHDDLIKSVDYWSSLRRNIKWWFGLQLSLLILYFGIRWVWTGKVRDKTTP